MVPDESENYNSALKPSASDVMPMIKMGTSINEPSKLKKIEHVLRTTEILDLEKHHFEEDMKRHSNSYRKPSHSHFIPSAHRALNLESESPKPDRDVDRIVFNQDMVSVFQRLIDRLVV